MYLNKAEIKRWKKKKKELLNPNNGGFSGGPVVKNPSVNAGDTDLIPGLGTKIPHAAGRLCLWAHCTTMKTQYNGGGGEPNNQNLNNEKGQKNPLKLSKKFGLPWWLSGKESASAEDMGLIPGLGRPHMRSLYTKTKEKPM